MTRPNSWASGASSVCGYDVDADGTIGTVASPDSGDYIYAAYDFDDPFGGGMTWHEVGFTHDHAGNLTGDGLFQYTYDAWNRLVGVWYHSCHVDGGGVPNVTTERVARYAYDGLFRRVEKEITHQGAGVVYRSDDRDGDGVADCTGVLAGDRQEHYYYAGWRLIGLPERRVARASRLRIGGTLGQLVYGTQYIDEPVRDGRCHSARLEGTRRNAPPVLLHPLLPGHGHAMRCR